MGEHVADLHEWRPEVRNGEVHSRAVTNFLAAGISSTRPWTCIDLIPYARSSSRKHRWTPSTSLHDHYVRIAKIQQKLSQS
jgi:hypothetical protein